MATSPTLVQHAVPLIVEGCMCMFCLLLFLKQLQIALESHNKQMKGKMNSVKVGKEELDFQNCYYDLEPELQS